MAQIFEATIVYIEQAVEELSSSPLYIRKLAESLTFRDFIQFLSTSAPHITAPIPEEGVQTCAAQTKKLEEEKKAKGREAPIDDRPESSKRPKQSVKQIIDQSGNQTGEQPGNGKDLPQLANELDQNEAVVGAATGSNETIVVHTASISKTRTMYEKEFGIMSANAAVVDPMKQHWFTFRTFNRCRHFNVKQEINDMFSECQKHLVFFRVKKELLRYLEDRKAVPGSRIEIPSAWNIGALKTITSKSWDAKIRRAYAQMKLYYSVNEKIASGFKPVNHGHLYDEIFGALKTITSKSCDAKIRRAYAQMKLYYSVNEKIASGFKPVNHGPLYDERDYLHELGLRAAGKVSDKEKD
ncbi:hypothetical protein OEA41_006310 [Lepraria neglecta]|uniref:Uncharacterized protein n=1 Tax=Lepraria neglecta TaxID=209136 RepID=A0AAD9ZA36_9LECA|nr:hypothetical protein OEA41_006310 [Lepraria neglecta]